MGEQRKKNGKRRLRCNCIPQKRIGVENDGNGGTIKTGRTDLSRYIGKPIIETDNKSIREWYAANVSDIPNQIDRSKPFEELHPVKSFEDLLKDKMERKNMSKEEALTDILKTASKTNKNVNQEFGM